MAGLQLLVLLFTVVTLARLPVSTWVISRNCSTSPPMPTACAGTSDDLTRMARLNAISGDPIYREYFDEVLAIRNGDMPRPEPYHEIPWWDIVLATGERPSPPGEPLRCGSSSSTVR